METARSKLLIEYNGVEATDIIANDSTSFTWTDNASGSADTLTINLKNEDQKWMNGFFPSDEDTLKAWIQLEEWPADYRQGKIYCGTFQVDSLSYGGFPNTATLSGISVPTGDNFNVKQKNRTWNKTTIKTVFNDIASDSGITLVFDAEDLSIESVSQSGKTDLSFIYSLGSEYGLAVKLYNDKLVVYDLTRYEAAPARYDINYSQLGGSGSYSIKKNNTKKCNSVKIQYTSDKKTLSYVYTIPGSSGNRQIFISSKAETYSDAEIKAKAALRRNIRESTTITLNMVGSAKYVAADCFNLVGFGKLDGKYFIDSVTHTRSGGKYTISIEAHLTVTDF